MSIGYKIIEFLQAKMTEPQAFGWFHLACMAITFLVLLFLYKRKDKHSEKQLKIVLGIYGCVALLFEILKQISWSATFTDGGILWNYEWYSFPFQLCTTPMFVSIACLFLKNGQLRECLLSYVAYLTILGSIATIFAPDTCLVEDVLVNIHTMWLHLGSFVVSVYLLVAGEVKLSIKKWAMGIPVFFSFVTIANILNAVVYNSGILHGETFNMFYISPYFISSLPVFDTIQESVPYPLFLIIYIVALLLGSFIILALSILTSRACANLNKRFSIRNA